MKSIFTDVVEVNLPDKSIQPESSKDGIGQKPRHGRCRNFSKPQHNNSDWSSCSARPGLGRSLFQVHTRGHSTIGELSPGHSDEKPDVIIIDPSTMNEEQETQSQWHNAQVQSANRPSEFCRQEYVNEGISEQRQSHTQREEGSDFNAESYPMDMNRLGSYNDMHVGLDNSCGEPHRQPFPWTLSDTEDNTASAVMHSQRSNRSFSCTLCGKRYMTVKQLKVHQKVHAGEKPYSCIQCGKRFIQLYSLKRHHRVHTGERPFRCAQCGKQFAHSSNLKVHQTVHTGEKNFHCAQCGKNFSFLSNLIRHQAIHVAK